MRFFLKQTPSGDIVVWADTIINGQRTIVSERVDVLGEDPVTMGHKVAEAGNNVLANVAAARAGTSKSRTEQTP